MLTNTGKELFNAWLTSQDLPPHNYELALLAATEPLNPVIAFITQLAECAFGGYARQAMGPWTINTFVNGDGTFNSAAPIVTFSNTSGADAIIYGWCIVDASDHQTALSYSNFSPPIVIRAGQTQTFQPEFYTQTL